MQGLKYLTAITKRAYSEAYVDFFKKYDATLILSKLCFGTANEKTLSYLGLEKTEMVMFETIVTDKDVPDIMQGLSNELRIDDQGNGIALLIPLDSIGGQSAKQSLIGDKSIEKKENDMSDNECKYVLIVTIVDKGNTDTVMECAKEAGAGGGTVIKAKGTGASYAKFFGLNISEEKEMVYIVAKKENRDSIMLAIMNHAGSETAAHGITFALPVCSVAGIKSFKD